MSENQELDEKDPTLRTHFHQVEELMETPMELHDILQELLHHTRKVALDHYIIPAPLPPSSGQCTFGTQYLSGFSLVETGGANRVTMIIHDGTDANGPVVAVAGVAVNGAQTQNFAVPIAIFHGLFIEYVGSGAPKGCCYINQE